MHRVLTRTRSHDIALWVEAVWGVPPILPLRRDWYATQMNKLTLLLGLSCAAALLGGCADRSTMVPAQLTQLAPLTRAMQPGVKAIPSCKGQHTTKQYAQSQAKSLNFNGGTLCVPKFQGWGGGLKYPGGASGVSATLISSTTAYAPSFFPPGVSAIFWIQFKPSSFVKFNTKLPAGVSLASSKLKVNKAYTIGGADYYASLFRVLPACYTIAANGTYGPMIGGLGYPLKAGDIHYAFIWVNPGKSVSNKC